MLHLRELHLHMCKDMEESHNSIPKPTMSKTLLVSNTGALNKDTYNMSLFLFYIGSS